MQISIDLRVLARLLQCTLDGWVCYSHFQFGEKFFWVYFNLIVERLCACWVEVG